MRFTKDGMRAEREGRLKGESERRKLGRRGGAAWWRDLR